MHKRENLFLLIALPALLMVGCDYGPYEMTHHGEQNVLTGLHGRWQEPVEGTNFIQFEGELKNLRGSYLICYFAADGTEMCRRQLFRLTPDGSGIFFLDDKGHDTNTKPDDMWIVDDFIAIGGASIRCPPAPCEFRAKKTPPRYWQTWEKFVNERHEWLNQRAAGQSK